MLYKNRQICQLEDMNWVIQNFKKREELNFLLNHNKGLWINL